MNKIVKLGFFGVVIVGLLAGCGTSEAKDKDTKVKATEEVKVTSASTAEINPKEWKDKSTDNGLEKTDFPTNTKDWIAFQSKIFSSPPNSKLMEAGYDKGYDYYLKADAVSNTLQRFIWVEGIDLEKDFENLRVLAAIIKHEHYVRTAHLDPEGTGNTKVHPEQWKPVSKRMELTYDYMRKLLNDLDVAINKDGKGDTFGVSHQLDGDKVSKMETFITYYDENK